MSKLRCSIKMRHEPDSASPPSPRHLRSLAVPSTCSRCMAPCGVSTQVITLLRLLGLSFGRPSGGRVLRRVAVRAFTSLSALGTFGVSVDSGSASPYSAFHSWHARRLHGFWQSKLTRRSAVCLLAPRLPGTVAQALVVLSNWLLELQRLTHSSYKAFTLAMGT